MPTYLVDFATLERFSKKVNDYEFRGVYWEEPERFVVEVPTVSTSGAFMGVVWRCEIPKADVANLVVIHSGSDVSEADVIKYFETAFLGVYTRVLGTPKMDITITEEIAEPVPFTSEGISVKS